MPVSSVHPIFTLFIRLADARRRIAAPAALAAGLALAVGCSSADVAVTAPSASKCDVAVEHSLPAAPATGASGVLRVSTTRDCTWEAASAAAWIELTGSRTGQGSAEVGYRVAPNPDPTSRRGTLSVNGSQLAVAQDPAPCRYDVTPMVVRVGAGAARPVVGVAAHGACGWSAASQADWIDAPGGNRTGAGQVTLEIDANTGGDRVGTVRVAGQSVRVEQEGAAPAPVPPTPPAPTPPPTPSPTPGPAPEPPTPSPSPSPTPSPSPSPSPSPTPDPSPTPSPGPSPTPSPSPSPSPGPAPTCAFEVSPTSFRIPAEATSISVSVTAPAGCAWSVTQVDRWIERGSPSSGTGSGTARLDIQKYKGGGAERVGTVRVAGVTVTVTQLKRD